MTCNYTTTNRNSHDKKHGTRFPNRLGAVCLNPGQEFSNVSQQDYTWSESVEQ